MQADGKILAGGKFTDIGGQPRNRIARLDATTGLADAFDPDAENEVFSIAVQADGKILVGGRFNDIGGQPRNRIARLDATTGLADSFNPDAENEVFSIAVQADGKILGGGKFTNIGGQPRNRIARLDATTGLADSFNPDAESEVLAIAVQADGKFLVGGRFVDIGGQSRNRLARFGIICPPVITQSASQAITAGNSASCNSGAPAFFTGITATGGRSIWRRSQIPSSTTSPRFRSGLKGLTPLAPARLNPLRSASTRNCLDYSPWEFEPRLEAPPLMCLTRH